MLIISAYIWVKSIKLKLELIKLLYYLWMLTGDQFNSCYYSAIQSDLIILFILVNNFLVVTIVLLDQIKEQCILCA